MKKITALIIIIYIIVFAAGMINANKKEKELKHAKFKPNYRQTLYSPKQKQKERVKTFQVYGLEQITQE